MKIKEKVLELVTQKITELEVLHQQIRFNPTLDIEHKRKRRGEIVYAQSILKELKEELEGKV